MKREASARSDAASAMMSSNVVGCLRLRAGARAVHDFMRPTSPLLRNFYGTVRRVIQIAAIVRRRSSAAVVFPGDPHCGNLRSEEHTSELQSLRHLVCR